MDNIKQDSILLIGGMATGKTTVARYLSEKTKLPYISIDAFKDKYLDNDSSYSFEKQLEIRKEKGYFGEMEYLLPFLHKALDYFLSNMDKPFIIDFGALSTIKLEDKTINEIKEFQNIFLLHSEIGVSNRREIDKDSELDKIYSETNENPINFLLTDKIVTIDNKKPEDIGDEILSKINKKTLI